MRFKRELGARIRQARESREGLDVIAEFSRRIQADRSAVGRWESGAGCPDAVNLRNIAEVTGVSADWLLRGFAAPSWRATFEEWTARPAQRDLSPRARIWLESLPLEGYAPDARFYDFVMPAFVHGLTPAVAVQMASDTLDAERSVERLSVAQGADRR